MPTTRTNLARNPSAETDAAQFSMSFISTSNSSTAPSSVNSALYRSSTYTPFSGSYYTYFNMAGTSSNRPAVRAAVAGGPVTGSLSYAASVGVYPSSPGREAQAYAGNQYLTSSGESITFLYGPGKSIESAQWFRPEVVATAPSNAANAIVHVYIYGPQDTTNRSYRIDGVLLEQSSIVGSYFDGDSANARWNGTPHASTSTLTVPDPPSSGNWLPFLAGL